MKKLFVPIVISVLFFSSCKEKPVPDTLYNENQTIGAEVKKIILPSNSDREFYKRQYKKGIKEVVLNIDIGPFYDIDEFEDRAQTFLFRNNYGFINYCLYSVTSDFSKVTGVLIPKIPLLDDDGRYIVGREKVAYSSDDIDEPNKKGWTYLYKYYEYDYRDEGKDILSGWHPYLHGSLDIKITPCAREDIVVIMKMLREEKLSESEKAIATKYESKVKKIISGYNYGE